MQKGRSLKHPCVVQLRGCEELAKLAEKFGGKIDRSEGVDVYFEDVNDARRFISRIKKLGKFRVKLSSSYAGVRGGRVRVLFVYSVRRDEDQG
ncbi:MAG: hypothetical protein ABWW66_00545 [Archaeoglobaceae archaeon]